MTIYTFINTLPPSVVTRKIQDLRRRTPSAKELKAIKALLEDLAMQETVTKEQIMNWMTVWSYLNDVADR